MAVGAFKEERCDYPAIPFDAANMAVDALMRDDFTHEWVMVTTGGDSAGKWSYSASKMR